MLYFQHLKPFLKCFLYIFLNVVIILVKINLYLFSDSWVFHFHDECHLNHFKYLDFIIREEVFEWKNHNFLKSFKCIWPWQNFLWTSLEDLGAATCKSFESPLKVFWKSFRSPSEVLQKSFRSPSEVLQKFFRNP